ncbi:MAG TPA: alpha/beta fold hydrolase [Streptosporangiaceae bacterium]|nr:alpha/beta fold hydrolase [Streptosporangiaceae bacterium]
MASVHHRYATIGGRRLFYREAGPAGAPAVVLLHGFPASSFMFRDLIPALADRYHVIAPDHLGFGLSDAPPAAEFGYTFDALAGLTAGLLSQLGVTRYALHVQDYGAPVGWRLALADPAAVTVTAIITQSGNGYEAGLTEDFWKPVREYWQDRSPHTEAAIRQALALDAIRWQYLHGVPDESLVSPDTWNHDFALVSRPGNDLVQLALFAGLPREVVAELERLRTENARLLRLLKLSPEQAALPRPGQAGLFEAPPGPVHGGSSPAEKVAFFGALFAARTDVADVPEGCQGDRGAGGAGGVTVGRGRPRVDVFHHACPGRDRPPSGLGTAAGGDGAARRMKLASYDRLFPSQDLLPAGGVGNLIAAPLFRPARDEGRTVFVDPGTLEPYRDQWAFLSTLGRMSPREADRAADKTDRVLTGQVKRLAAATSSQTRPPAAPVIGARLGAGIRLELAELTPSLAATLRHTASIPNPVFYERQRMRASTWNVPRFLHGFDETIDGGLILPRGLTGTVTTLAGEAGSRLQITDERSAGDRAGIYLHRDTNQSPARGRRLPSRASSLGL